MKILVLVENSLHYDERVKRQIRSFLESGHTVEVIGLLFNAGLKPISEIYGAPIHDIKYGKSFKGLLFIQWLRLSFINKLVTKAIKAGLKNYLLEKNYVAPLSGLFKSKGRQLSFDLIIGNDLNAAVSAMELSQLTGKPFIYDAHEYYSGQSNRLNAHEKRAIQSVEKKVVDAASGWITVSYAIKNRLNQMYGPKNWTVILNIPDLQRYAIPIANNNGIIKVVYHTANLSLTGRNVKLLVDAMANTPLNYHLTLIGNCKGTGKDVLYTYLQEHIKDRFELKDAMPLSVLLTFATTCDIGAVLNDPNNENTNLTIPNKIFEYMSAGLAIVSFDVEGTRFLFREKAIGQITSSIDKEGLKTAITSIGSDKTLMETLKANSFLLASEKYNWQNEKKKFEDVISSL